MATRQPSPPLSYVLRKPGMRSEYKGSHTQGIELLFVALPDALARRKMIDALEKAHARLLQREDGPDGEQRDAAQVGALAGSQVDPCMALPSIPTARSIKPDECAASGEGHSYTDGGPNGERQCRYCGEAPK